MSVWTLAITDRLGPRSIIGHATDPYAGMVAALRALAATNAGSGFDHPRYIIAVDDGAPAIISTGVDEAGLPDHRGIAEMVNRMIDNASEPF